MSYSNLTINGRGRTCWELHISFPLLNVFCEEIQPNLPSTKISNIWFLPTTLIWAHRIMTGSTNLEKRHMHSAYNCVPEDKYVLQSRDLYRIEIIWGLSFILQLVLQHYKTESHPTCFPKDTYHFVEWECNPFGAIIILLPFFMWEATATHLQFLRARQTRSQILAHLLK